VSTRTWLLATLRVFSQTNPPSPTITGTSVTEEVSEEAASVREDAASVREDAASVSEDVADVSDEEASVRPEAA